MIKPASRLGRWAASLSSLGLFVFILNIAVIQQTQNVVNTNTSQAVTGKINDTFLTQLPLYAVFALLIFGGILAVIAITKRDRAVLTWLAGLIGLLALWIFVGGFFVES